jgi:hypothetical protein
MRMRFYPILVILPLSACAERPVPPPALPPLTVGFAAGEADVIDIVMADSQPVEEASLIAPDGKASLAYRIERARQTAASPAGIDAGLGLGLFGGSYGTGVSSGFGIGFPLFGSPPPPAEPLVQSHALIRVSDMAAYRAGWRNWKLHLRLGSPETSERDVEFPAPRPPES